MLWLVKYWLELAQADPVYWKRERHAHAGLYVGTPSNAIHIAACPLPINCAANQPLLTTGLSLACENGRTKTCALLMPRIPVTTFNSPQRWVTCPVLLAVKRGDVDLVRRLLDLGAVLHTDALRHQSWRLDAATTELLLDRVAQVPTRWVVKLAKYLITRGTPADGGEAGDRRLFTKLLRLVSFTDMSGSSRRTSRLGSQAMTRRWIPPTSKRRSTCSGDYSLPRPMLPSSKTKPTQRSSWGATPS
jgi:hypothetical protein